MPSPAADGGALDGDVTGGALIAGPAGLVPTGTSPESGNATTVVVLDDTAEVGGVAVVVAGPTVVVAGAAVVAASSTLVVTGAATLVTDTSGVATGASAGDGVVAVGTVVTTTGSGPGRSGTSTMPNVCAPPTAAAATTAPMKIFAGTIVNAAAAFLAIPRGRRGRAVMDARPIGVTEGVRSTTNSVNGPEMGTSGPDVACSRIIDSMSPSSGGALSTVRPAIKASTSLSLSRLPIPLSTSKTLIEVLPRR